MTDNERNIMEYIIKNLKPMEKVEMSLAKYEDMISKISDLKTEIRELKKQVDRFNYLFNMIEIPIDMVKDIGPDDISVEQYYDPMSRITTRMVRINTPGDWREYE